METAIRVDDRRCFDSRRLESKMLLRIAVIGLRDLLVWHEITPAIDDNARASRSSRASSNEQLYIYVNEMCD